MQTNNKMIENKMKEELSKLEAFKSMFAFLQKYYEQTRSDDVGSLLSEMHLLEDGSTADPAAWEDWIECIHIVKTKGFDIKASIKFREREDDV